jgi:hypothetical protein
MIKGQRERKVRIEKNASFTNNDKILIKMTDIVKDEAPRGPHGPLRDQRSKEKKG